MATKRRRRRRRHGHPADLAGDRDQTPAEDARTALRLLAQIGWIELEELGGPFIRIRERDRATGEPIGPVLKTTWQEAAAGAAA